MAYGSYYTYHLPSAYSSFNLGCNKSEFLEEIQKGTASSNSMLVAYNTTLLSAHNTSITINCYRKSKELCMQIPETLSRCATLSRVRINSVVLAGH